MYSRLILLTLWTSYKSALSQTFLGTNEFSLSSFWMIKMRKWWVTTRCYSSNPFFLLCCICFYIAFSVRINALKSYCMMLCYYVWNYVWLDVVINKVSLLLSKIMVTWIFGHYHIVHEMHSMWFTWFSHRRYRLQVLCKLIILIRSR